MTRSERRLAVDLTAGLSTTAECAYRELSRGACVVPYLSEMRKIIRELEKIEERS